MRSKSPELMKEICTFVSDYYRDRRTSPSVSAIAKGVGIAKTTAYRYLVEMNERGMISYDGHTIETPQIDKCVTGYFSAPIVGSSTAEILRLRKSMSRNMSVFRSPSLVKANSTFSGLPEIPW